MKYTPLHVHSHYSLLDGLSKIDDLVDKAKADGMTSLALTDHGVMYGAIEFYQKCKANGIKPIIGVEAYIVKDRKRKEANEEERFHAVLLAKNYDGYKNLIKLTTIAHLEGFYYRPRIDWELLEKYGSNIICLTACLAGEIPRAIQAGLNDEKIEEIIKRYQRVFGQENFFLEVQHHPNIPEQKVVNNKIFELGRRLNIPIVATNDSHYLNSEDAEAHDILICLQTKHVLSDTNRMSYLGEDFSLKTSEQMSDIFRGNLEVLENTNKVAAGCQLEIPLGQIKLPYFEMPQGKIDFDYLRELCYANLFGRYGFKADKQPLEEKEKKIIERLEYELGVIKKTDYASYFLIVQDFVVWAKNNGIIVGPGRGSAAGSVVAYLLHITNLDPLPYDLLFERFLNPDRISLPDIDIDFADERRDEVIRYVEAKYGKDHVSQIITFGTMAARAAVRDVGRVLAMPYSFCDQIAKLIPANEELDEAIEKVAEVKEIYQSNPEAKRLLDFARKLEGVVRHASTHACGVVITREPVDNYCPCQFARDEKETVITQYSLHPVEDLGLLKMDFLGLKNLTIIERTCEIIEKIHDRKIVIDEIPLNDLKTYRLFQDGQTTGVFQFESSGMKRYLKQLRPSEFEDLIAMVALYRPGPLNSGMVDEFISRKHGEKQISYSHPLMKNSLQNTYGVIVYQEQVMQLSKDMAGYTGGQADTLRKAMGKKIVDLMEKMKKSFIEGCVKNNISEWIAKETFTSMEKFAEYGFNKSHAACYALIAYQTAYLKANYSAEFMASLLTSDQDDLDRISVEIDECKQLGIEILPPSISESFSTFTVVAESLQTAKPRIRFGLNAIRNVGENVSKELIHERKKNGDYQSLVDFLSRVGGNVLNKKSLEGLIKSGALDLFGRRAQLLDNMDKLLLFIKEAENAKASKQINIFNLDNKARSSLPQLVLRPSADLASSQLLSWEKEFLGLYVSEHPFNEFKGELVGLIAPVVSLAEMDENRMVRVGGVISTIKKIITKKGDPMLFVTIEDALRAVECLVFPKLYKEHEALWLSGAVVVIEGALSLKEGQPKILCNRIWPLGRTTIESVKKDLAIGPVALEQNGYRRFHQNNRESVSAPIKPQGQLIINYPLGASKNFADKAKMLFMAIPGKRQVILKVQGKLIKTNFFIEFNNDIKTRLEEVFGANCVNG